MLNRSLKIGYTAFSLFNFQHFITVFKKIKGAGGVWLVPSPGLWEHLCWKPSVRQAAPAGPPVCHLFLFTQSHTLCPEEVISHNFRIWTPQSYFSGTILGPCILEHSWLTYPTTWQNLQCDVMHISPTKVLSYSDEYWHVQVAGHCQAADVQTHSFPCTDIHPMPNTSLESVCVHTCECTWYVCLCMCACVYVWLLSF